MSYLCYLCLFSYSGVNTYCVVGFFSACVPYLASFSGLSMFSIVFVAKTCGQTMKHNLNEKKR